MSVVFGNHSPRKMASARCVVAMTNNIFHRRVHQRNGVNAARSLKHNVPVDISV